MRKLPVILAVLVMSVTAFAGSLRADIEASNAKICGFLKNKDIDGFEKYARPRVTDDFKHVENGQSMTFDEMIAQMRAGIGSTGKVTMVTTKILEFKTKGDICYVLTRHAMVATTPPDPKNKTHKMGFTGTSNDVYKKIGGKWKMASMTWLKQTMTMDGKPFDPSKMGGAQPSGK